MATAWETKFAPLIDEETSQCWIKFATETKVDKSKIEALYHLSDRGFLVVTQTFDVFPSNVALLLESLDFEGKTSKYRILLRKYLPMAAKGVFSAGVAAGVKVGWV